jgi:hypothetical protein
LGIDETRCSEFNQLVEEELPFFAFAGFGNDVQLLTTHEIAQGANRGHCFILSDWRGEEFRDGAHWANSPACNRPKHWQFMAAGCEQSR